MKEHPTMMGRLVLLALVLLLLAASRARILAQDPQVKSAEVDGYELSWYSVDGGGTVGSSGGTYTLSGTAGQSDARGMVGGSYTLVGGVWAGLGVAQPYGIYLPRVVR